MPIETAFEPVDVRREGEDDRWWTLRLLPVRALIPHERTDALHVDRLFGRIRERDVWTHPLLVESRHHVILDGHHRHAASERLQLSVVPCAVVDYDHRYIRVGSWREDRHVDRSAVMHAAIRGPLLPPKTSRHSTEFPISECLVPLAQLRTGH
ncbi:ParB N-terminal domain-containing protein [Methylobacterium nodulans]|uniref:ParB domain protein nuclease n=1 Tax=Methylobacterium nodulans (strain LMG 21967 / CNCM I-2342 / ORS 2060) TaxID=460265 RepID=B8IVZ3_METNO|nr:ParB N-terminal domain-containing protein [Methylobacterium nodulans]ACL62583.1 ParB domain protein nuclease [Methylobacterium nodulans ORS 2060]